MIFDRFTNVVKFSGIANFHGVIGEFQFLTKLLLSN